MTTVSSFFHPTSPFVIFATLATRSICIQLLRMTAVNCRATLSETIRIYFDGTTLTERITCFKLLLNQYLRTCYIEYLSIHQQILNKKLLKSYLNEDDMDHYVYCTMEKIMSEKDGYKHLNCMFDGIMQFCLFQFEHVFAIISYEGMSIISSSDNCDENFSMTELNLLDEILQSQLNRINSRSQTLYLNNIQYKSIHLKCEEDNSCQSMIEFNEFNKKLIN